MVLSSSAFNCVNQRPSSVVEICDPVKVRPTHGALVQLTRMWLPGLCIVLIGYTTATDKKNSNNVSQIQLSNDSNKLMDYDLTVLLNNAYPGKNNIPVSLSSTLETKSPPDQTPSDSTQQNINTGETGEIVQSPIDCVCVPFYQCHANKSIVEDGAGIIDIRIRDGPCEDFLQFCCKPEETTDPGESITQTPPIQPLLDSCGHRNIFGVSSLRIKGADHNEAQFGEFPWMIAILTKVFINNTRVNLFQCGGSLLNPQVVLTAAHCVKGKENLRVRAGEWDTQRKTEPLPAQTRSIKEVVIHEQYYRGALFNDIALLFLEFPMELAPNVAPICLPQQGESMAQRNCVASGWGKDVYGKEGEYQVILKKVDLPIVPRDECLSSFRKTILGKNFKLHSSFLCAGGIPNRDTCSMHLWAKFMLTLCLLSTTTAEPPENQKFCECVPIHQCDFRRKSDGPGNIDVRVDTSNCPNLLDICCSFDDLLLETRSPSLPSALPSCGQQYLPEPNFRITGDREAEYGEFPWMAALLNSEKHFICGGSLIHPLVVLTAGHCVANIETKMLVQMGDWDSQARSEPLPVQNRAVSQIVLHEKYTPGSLFNDIALLILDSPVQLGGNVGTVCLPDANEDMEGRRCLVSGWGKNTFGGIGRQAAILKTVQLAVTPRCECQQSLRKTKLGQFFKLHISFMCAGGDEGRDSCEGDGGGPLVCPSKQNPSVFSQAGIVSWGVNCGQPIPAIYTNVALFRSWIDLQMLRLRLIS